MKYVSTYNHEEGKKDKRYQELNLSHFDTFYLTGPGFTWADAEKLDRYEEGLDFLLSQGKKVIGHCLIHSRAGFIKVKQLKHFQRVMKNYEEKQEMVKEYLQYTLKRFEGKIDTWYVFNEVSKSACIAENAFGPTFAKDVCDICIDTLPHGDFRINEYGFQNKAVIDRLITKTSGSDLNIGIQVYTTGKNPLLGNILRDRIQTIKKELPGKEIYFSEVAVINKNPIFYRTAYSTILKVAKQEGIKELGLYWPFDKYNYWSWDVPNTVGLWKEDYRTYPQYFTFFPKQNT